MNNQLNIFEARNERDRGMQRASDHAENTYPGWNEIAFAELKKFLIKNPGEFMGEDFRSHCAMMDDFPLPPSNRAFGGIMVRAVKAGLIKKVRIDQVKNKNAHCANAAVWTALR